MTAPLSLAAFDRLPPSARAGVVDGLDARIDAVAARAAEPHRFLRHGWYAAALAAYGGAVRTLVVEQEGVAVLALPFTPSGPAWAGLGQVPGSYWPFRGFPLALEAADPALAAALDALAGQVRALRIGPILADDPAAAALASAARARGWAVLDRVLGQSWVQDLTDPDWPRASTLKKNRFHAKHLAAHGALDWRFLSGDDWPHAFDLLATVERASWVADGCDAKFTATGHGRFWRAAAADPVLARCLRAALLTVNGAPAAFSFDLDVGSHRYAIANSYRADLAKHSPGKLLHYRNLLDARARGISCVDWGMGDGGYKATLGAVPGPAFVDRLLLRPGLPALAGRLLARWLWR
ncbi:GNAT family N-acetyltransferase [Sphingomonas sp.]|uniref:GNAT family N-acetyltransferase n=1 Tax=Sphingomonas sp. TaxID=28214 RepID=UPI003AFFF607